MNDANLLQDDARSPRYRSSAAARMVNIPVATLRVWERRYQVVGPTQSASGQRLYSSQDVRRLVLIKQLVNRGHAIGMLARMATAALQDLLDEARDVDQSLQVPAGAAHTALRAASASVVASTVSVRTGAGGGADPQGPHTRVVLVGPTAGLRWASSLQALPEFELVAQADASAGSELSLRQVRADVLLADLGAIHMETVDWLVRVQQMVGARQMVVVYGFANTQVLDALRVRGALLKRTPLSPEDLLSGLRETVRGWHSVSLALRQLPDPAPAPRSGAHGGADFSDAARGLRMSAPPGRPGDHAGRVRALQRRLRNPPAGRRGPARLPLPGGRPCAVDDGGSLADAGEGRRPGAAG
jgi:MerR family transcriptional regulator, light-induced transcriptional regulator